MTGDFCRPPGPGSSRVFRRAARRTSISPSAQLDLDEALFAENYDRVPFGFTHNLHQLPLFEEETLRSLRRTYADHPEDYFVSGSAPPAGTLFYSVAQTPLKPHEAIDQLAAESSKILLKPLERHHDGFRDLLDQLFAQVKGDLGRNHFPDEVVRLESSLFIGAPQATTRSIATPRSISSVRSRGRRSII